MKMYTIDRRGILIVFIIGWVGLVFSLYLGIQDGSFTEGGFYPALLFFTIPIVLVIILTTIFSYASISGKTLKFVWLFFYRRTIDIDSITDINDQQTFKVAKSQFRSLYIFYKDKSGVTKWIELRITIFPEKTLGRLIRDLKQINPRIELNKYAQKLMDSAPQA